MAAAADIQAGTARIYAIQNSGSAIAITVTAQALTSPNLSSVSWNDSFKVDEIASMNGSVVETLIASQRRREITIELIPSGTDRAAASTQLDNLLDNLKPLAVITLANFKDERFNGTFNYMGGAEVTLKRDTEVVTSVKCAQFETAGTADSFAALAIAT